MPRTPPAPALHGARGVVEPQQAGAKLPQGRDVVGRQAQRLAGEVGRGPVIAAPRGRHRLADEALSEHAGRAASALAKLASASPVRSVLK